MTVHQGGCLSFSLMTWLHTRLPLHDAEPVLIVARVDLRLVMTLQGQDRTTPHDRVTLSVVDCASAQKRACSSTVTGQLHLPLLRCAA